MKNDQQQCCRCGTCCEKGGPALHMEDRELVLQGKIPAGRLYTIRQGEPVRDNVRGDRIVPSHEEIIKIKGTGESWECCLYDPHAGCTCYEHRPLECRAMKCWDTDEISRMYDKERLTRRFLFERVPWMIELIEEHEQRCDYERLNLLLKAVSDHPAPETVNEIREMVAYDRHLRKVVTESSSVDEQWLDLIFGRPMTKILPLFGISVEDREGKLVLSPIR